MRHIILNDDKSSSYKLALLRTLCRIADSYPGTVRDVDDETVAVPMGLVGLVWLRLFRPLLDQAYPQAPRNLGFVKEPYRALTGRPAIDLRPGAVFRGDEAAALHGAMRDAIRTIRIMPMRYMTYLDGTAVLQPDLPARAPRYAGPEIRITREYLSAWGEIRIGANLWRAIQRFGCWVEPSLIAEWQRLIGGYAERAGMPIDMERLYAAFHWSEPSRDVRLAVDRARELRDHSSLWCVWTGKRLRDFDIDHCLPYSAWPCDDLWNLLPAQRRFNRHVKREKLPSFGLLDAAAERIHHWWEAAYLSHDVFGRRFAEEARASLGVAAHSVPRNEYLEGVLHRLELTRMRLRNDQQIAECPSS